MARHRYWQLPLAPHSKASYLSWCNKGDFGLMTSFREVVEPLCTVFAWLDDSRLGDLLFSLSELLFSPVCNECLGSSSSSSSRRWDLGPMLLKTSVVRVIRDWALVSISWQLLVCIATTPRSFSSLTVAFTSHPRPLDGGRRMATEMQVSNKHCVTSCELQTFGAPVKHQVLETGSNLPGGRRTPKKFPTTTSMSYCRVDLLCSSSNTGKIHSRFLIIFHGHPPDKLLGRTGWGQVIDEEPIVTNMRKNLILIFGGGT